MRPSSTSRSWPWGAIVVVAIALLSAGAVLGLGQLHRASAKAGVKGGGRAAGAQTRAAAAAKAGVLVTRDFGARTLASGGAPAPGGTVMDALRGIADVETAYGGGFVNSIDGLASGYTGGKGESADWFYCVNGVLADRGAGDYRLRADERVWWDFHRWDGISVRAVVGHYPEPFAHGYDGHGLPTQVVFGEGFASDAEKVAGELRQHGVAVVTTVPLQPSLAPPSASHVVLVGTFPQLLRVGWLAETAAQPGAGGLLATFSAGRMQALTASGQTTETGAAGAVLATARADAPAATIWLVTGGSEAAAHRAADLVAARPGELAGRFGVLVPADGPSRALPLAVAP